MFCSSKPSRNSINAFMSAQQNQKFSYREVGYSRQGQTRGYSIDHNRIKLGQGVDIFERAKQAITQWKMFDMPWIDLCWPDTPIEPGSTVAVVISHFGFWSVNLSRIVFVEDPSSFAYGTLAEHAESGEEKFSVIWNASDDSVWYDIVAFSKPNHALAKIGYPLARLLQKRFARDSVAAMKRFTESPRSPW